MRDLPDNELMRLISEFEGANLRGTKVLRRYDNEAKRKALSIAYKDKVEPTMQDFESWLKEKQVEDSLLSEEEVGMLIAKYLYCVGSDDLFLYIKSANPLHYTELFSNFIDSLITRGVKFERSNADFDYLEFYRNFSLRAVFLYTSEDREIQEYLDTNHADLDKLSGDFCLIFVTLDRHKNREDAYDFVEKLDVLNESKFNAFSQLPGIFFWDKYGASEFISFGSEPNIVDIRFVLRTIFGEIRQSASILSVYRARKLLNDKDLSKDRKDESNSSGESFHIILKRERELRGWSQEALAQKLGCDLKTVCRWENGKGLPQSFLRQMLSQLFNKDLLELGLIQGNNHASIG